MVLAEPCSMPGTMHFGLTDRGRASAAFPSPAWAGKTLMWRTTGELWSGDYFLKTMQTEERDCCTLRCRAFARQRWQRDNGSGSPASKPGSREPAQKMPRRLILGPEFFCSWPSPPHPPPATPQQGELKDSTEEFVPPVPSLLPCAVTVSPSQSH